MKKLLTLLAFVAFTGALNAQTSSTDAVATPEKTEKIGCAKGEAKAGCCARKAKASAEVGAGSVGEAAHAEGAVPTHGCGAAKAAAGHAHGDHTSAASGAEAIPTEARPAGCCAGKAKAGMGCHGAKAGLTNGEVTPVEHVCSAACKDGAHHQ